LGYNRLFIWVEGSDDVRFFDNVFRPFFEEKYDFVEVRPYAHLKKEKISKFLKSITAMKADYIYVADINNALCITAKKQEIHNLFKNILADRIVIVVKEI